MPSPYDKPKPTKQDLIKVDSLVAAYQTENDPVAKAIYHAAAAIVGELSRIAAHAGVKR